MDHEKKLLQEPEEEEVEQFAYRPEDVILEPSDPLIKILYSSYRLTHCYNCLKLPEKFRLCECKVIGYCNIYCQIKDWDNCHYLECQSVTFRKTIDSYAHTEQLLLMRLYVFVKLNPEKLKVQHRMYDGTYRCFNNLSKNEQTWSNIRHVYGLCGDLARQLQVEDWNVKTKDFTRLFDIFRLNSFPINMEEEVVGAGIYLPLSHLKHSCKPNARCSQANGQFTVRALTNIPVGEQPTICYLQDSIDVGGKVRRNLLWDKYHIECNCERCMCDDGQMFDLARLNARFSNTTEYDALNQQLLPREWNSEVYSEYEHQLPNQVAEVPIYNSPQLAKVKELEQWEQTYSQLQVQYRGDNSIYQFTNFSG